MRTVSLICLLVAGGAVVGDAQTTVKTVDFDRDIRPILSDRCYFCHGPDQKQRQAGLRLDLEADARHVISPGAPDDSELWLRIVSEDDDERMPPPSSRLEVSAEERLLIRAWIQQGGNWKKHWAFEPRGQPQPPEVPFPQPVANPIDRFLLKKLEQQRLTFSPRATPERLIRRVTFDLTGLPPTLEELDAFLSDSSPQAWETLVDRLLKSPHFGQRMASDWLDVARYADTFGYQVDRDRFVWPWRDWVIRAFNENKPYDQFITEQLAGDLLDSPSDDQILATTFNRLHSQKVEGGSVEEEFRVEYVADRTHTFATAFLGLTLECARCHDHKFDPISQQEYYQLFSFFNNIDEAGLYSFFTSSVPTPTLPLATVEQKQRVRECRQAVQQLQEAAPMVDLDDAKLRSVALELMAPAIETVDFTEIEMGGNQRSVDDRGRAAVTLTGDDPVTLTTGNFTRSQPFSVTLRLWTPDVKQRAVIFHRSRAWTDAGSRGYQLLMEDGRLSASLIHFWPGNAISVKTRDPLAVQQWLDVAVTYDGSSRADGLQIFVNGRRVELQVVKDTLSRNITGGGGDTITLGERFRDRGFTAGRISSFQVFDRQLSDWEVVNLQRADEDRAETLLKASGQLSPAHRRMLQQHYWLNHAEQGRGYLERLRAAREALCQAQDAIPEIMVMREMPEPRPAFLLDRGLYDQPRQPVSMGTPQVLPPFDPRDPLNRLGLANWLTQPDHPLTARVAVNHFWQLIFGRGLVPTPDDFGRQGGLPTHPELLDWLANDFVEHGWDVQRLLKQMVMSDAYRQSSAASGELLSQDPENRWLARAPAYRLPAEMLRDNALAVSGLLVDKLGGPPAKPYELAASFKPSDPDVGEGLYRRSVYTYWKRTGPAPVMMTLDAAKREVCQVRRERTSTPLQALAMLNSPQFVEACRAFSHRLLQRYGPEAQQDILQTMFRQLTSRHPTSQEAAVILKLYQQQLRYFQDHPQATELYLSHGQFGEQDAQQAKAIPCESAILAAWSSVANTLINHDECVTKR